MKVSFAHFVIKKGKDSMYVLIFSGITNFFLIQVYLPLYKGKISQLSEDMFM